MVGSTVEIKVRFQISPVYCRRGLNEGPEGIKWELEFVCFYPEKMAYRSIGMGFGYEMGK